MCDAIVSVFFPAGCRICGELLTQASRIPICGECLASFVPVGEKVCEICGRPMPPVTSSMTSTEGAKQLCPICREQPGQEKRIYAFDRARSYAVYEGALVRAILLLKFERMEPLGVWFAERLAEGVKGEGLGADAGGAVPPDPDRDRRGGE